MTKLSVAALQLAFTDDTVANIRAVSELVREAASKGAEVVLPPELFEGPYFCRVEDEGLFANARRTEEHPSVVALQSGDAQYYNEQIMPGIAQNFAKQGRSFDSSGYAQALAQAAQGQNRQRETFLSDLTAKQYEGNKANAYNAYMNNAGYAQNRYDAGQSYLTGRANELGDFAMQRDAYDQYLKRYGKRSGGGGCAGDAVLRYGRRQRLHQIRRYHRSDFELSVQ